MANAPPPGTANSLPARPPAPSAGANARPSGFRPAFGSASRAPAPQPYAAVPPQYPGAGASGYAAPANYAPRGNQQYGTSYGSPSYQGYPSAGGPGVSPSAQPYSYPAQQRPQQPQPQPQPQLPQQQQGYGPQNPGYGSAGYAPPQIQNPFPLPGTAGAGGFDSAEAAQIAEWQSAYNSVPPQVGKDGKNFAITAELPKAEAPAAAADPNRKKTVVRQGGGKKWNDDTLLEWDPSHLRLFVGNLAGETTDESLLKAFSRWKSVQRARVIRDKRTTKSKGYGFVSFSDADDFFQAAKEMNGKYIQSHPVVVRKANTEIKVSNARERGKGGKNGSNHSGGNGTANRNKSGSQHGGYEPSLGPIGAVGVTKPGQKTKNGLRLLG